MGLINAWKGFWTSGEGFGGKLSPRKKPIRMYAGAATSRLNTDWMAAATSADAEIKGSIKRLRQRSRQLVRDDPHARQAVRSILLMLLVILGLNYRLMFVNIELIH